MKNRRSVQIASVMLAFSMFTTYVVYSQRHPTRGVAPGSKQIALDEVKKPEISGNQSTNVTAREKIAVAPGSKAMAPILTIRPGTSVATTNAPKSGSRRVIVAPGSKSAPVFDLSQAQAAGRLSLSPASGPTTRVTNAAASMKSQR